MAQYNLDNVTVSAEFFGHVLLQWASILSLLYLLRQNISKLTLLTKTWFFYMSSQVCVCTMAYFRLQLAKNYESKWQEELIWNLWRFFVSCLALSIISIGITFMYIGKEDNKLLTYYRKVLPIYAVIYFIILFGTRLILPGITDLWLFINTIIGVILETVCYTKFINANIANGELKDIHTISVNRLNIKLTIFNAISFVVFNGWFIVDGNGWIGIAQRFIGGIWYASNTYAFIHLTKMKCFQRIRKVEVLATGIASSHNASHGAANEGNNEGTNKLQTLGGVSVDN